MNRPLVEGYKMVTCAATKEGSISVYPIEINSLARALYLERRSVLTGDHTSHPFIFRNS
jgi:hypothetical protein